MTQPVTWPEGARCANMMTFDLDGESPWIHRDPALAETLSMGAVKNPLPAACSVCDERDPQITLFYAAGLVVRLHAGCEALWQQERER